MYSVGEVIRTLEQFAPKSLAESWDPVGLQVGALSEKVERVLCALDLNEEVLEEALRQGARLIVTHHPFIFKPLPYLDLETYKGRIIRKLIKHDIAVYSMHTNFDIVKGGINDYLADQLGIENKDLLHITKIDRLQKLAIYTPKEAYRAVREVLIQYNDCKIGDYKGCTFGYEGISTFIPLEGSNPYIGKQNELAEPHEIKVECMIHPNDLNKVMHEVRKVHPYEEVAYDVYDLNHMNACEGLGRIGNCEPLSIRELAIKLKTFLGCNHVRIVGDENRIVSSIALCSGSGASFIGAAAKRADVYITGDLSFHEAQEAKYQGLSLIDIGHYPSEKVAIPLIQKYLKQHLEGIEVVCSEVDGEMFKVL